MHENIHENRSINLMQNVKTVIVEEALRFECIDDAKVTFILISILILS